MKRHEKLGSLLNTMIIELNHRQQRAMKATMADLSRRLEIGVSAIYKWRSGENQPPADILAQVVTIGVEEAGMDRLWVRQVLYAGEFPFQRQLLESFPHLARGSVPHNLPRRPFTHLVGREAEIQAIQQRLSSRHAGGSVLMEGLGGVGKSAVALEVAWRYIEHYAKFPPEERFGAIIWLSAKPERLTPQTITPYPRTCVQLTDVYQSIATVLEVAPKLTGLPPQAQQRGVIQALSKHNTRVLLILDGLETLDIPALLTLLRTFPANTKTLLTSRCHANLPAPIQLQPLEPAASRAWIQQLCAQYEVVLPPEDVARLVQAAAGLPLAIEWSMGRMALQGYRLATVIQQLYDPRGDFQRFLFHRPFTQLQTHTPKAYHWLETLARLDINMPVRVSTLAQLTGEDEEALRPHLYALVNWHLGFFSDAQQHFALHPFTLLFVPMASSSDFAGDGTQPGA